MRQEFFKNARRIVIKVGTSVLSHDGQLSLARVKALASGIARLKKRSGSVQVILVSSGAIGAALAFLGLKKRPVKIEELQALAAIGQPRLMQMYMESFGTVDVVPAQVLLTWQDLASRARFENTRRTLEQLVRQGALPIVNENDTVSTQEIEFGDNDQLSSMVASLFNADLLVLLTDAEGLYADMKAGASSRLPLVEDLNAEHFALVQDEKKAHTKGGMASKLGAVQKALKAGIPCVMASGAEPRILDRLFDGEDLGTLFLPKINKLSSKKHWIAYISKSEGVLVIDDGAKRALTHGGRSLLAAGLVKATGHFEAGSAVAVKDAEGQVLGKGIVNFSSTDLAQIRGHKASAWEAILGRPCSGEVLHRDNFVPAESLEGSSK
ncbi:MAG: glutamate 5-kinase [Candidatus Omnitrophica bacterium]|nr:glutamate 5-kinase [Candidatus Omnitrophota bacterium]